MSMTLEQAKRLKDAGFPQTKEYRAIGPYAESGETKTGSSTQCRFWWDTEDEKFVCLSGAAVVSPAGWYIDSSKGDFAAPNSDELIAAILERWDFTDIAIEKAGEHWCISVPARPDWGYVCGPTLLDALVDLYCKLAAGGGA